MPQHTFGIVWLIYPLDSILTTEILAHLTVRSCPMLYSLYAVLLYLMLSHIELHIYRILAQLSPKISRFHFWKQFLMIAVWKTENSSLISEIFRPHLMFIHFIRVSALVVKIHMNPPAENWYHARSTDSNIGTTMW